MPSRQAQKVPEPTGTATQEKEREKMYEVLYNLVNLVQRMVDVRYRSEFFTLPSSSAVPVPV
jgi:hypothetical protein